MLAIDIDRDRRREARDTTGQKVDRRQTCGEDTRKKPCLLFLVFGRRRHVSRALGTTFRPFMRLVCSEVPVDVSRPAWNPARVHLHRRDASWPWGIRRGDRGSAIGVARCRRGGLADVARDVSDAEWCPR